MQNDLREALDRLKMAAHVYEDDEMAADCATLEALLSARPLALGGQQGEFNVEEYVADYEFRADGEGGCYTPTENERALLIDAIHGALSELSLSTTPARAEAQDEGAADWAVIFKHHLGTSSLHDVVAEYIAQQAHPSPTPAADADRVREAVEALRPFSLVSQLIDRYFPDRPDDTTFQSGAGWIDKDGGERTLTLGDFRRAFQAFAALKSEGK